MKSMKHMLAGSMLAALTLITTGTASADDLISESRPSVVIVDKGMARSFTTDTLHNGIYAFTFDQQGLMASLGLQRSKITRID
jgi:hypothetical protein